MEMIPKQNVTLLQLMPVAPAAWLCATFHDQMVGLFKEKNDGIVSVEMTMSN